MSSEVAHLRAQIEAECQALALVFHGFVKTASHEVIMNKFRAIDRHIDQLAQQVGEDEAVAIAVEAYNQVV